MLYRVETGLHANITDTQGRKTALHLLKALQIPVAAIRQIKEKDYPQILEDYGGDILLVGINYDAKSKKHTCKIEKYH